MVSLSHKAFRDVLYITGCSSITLVQIPLANSVGAGVVASNSGEYALTEHVEALHCVSRIYRQ